MPRGEQISRQEWVKLKKREEARDRRKVERDKVDVAMSGIKAVFEKRGCPAVPARVSRGYTIYCEGKALSRIRQCDKWWEVLWWSHRDKWESIGEMGGVLFGTVEEAATYVLDDPMGMDRENDPAPAAVRQADTASALPGCRIRTICDSPDHLVSNAACTLLVTDAPDAVDAASE